MKPRAAQMRQKQAQQRRSKLEEIAEMAQAQAMRNPQLQRQLGAMNMRSRDPNRGVITQSEWNELVEKNEDSGRMFRYFFGLMIVGAIVLLGLSKYDEEFVIEVPQIENGRGFGEILSSAHNVEKAGQMSAAELQSYYEALGVQAQVEAHRTGTANAEDPDKQRRLENYRIRKEVKKAFQNHQEKQGQLVHCGRACEAKNMQVELAYNKLASQVDRELFGVLLDSKNTKDMRSASPEQLKAKFEEKKDHILKNEKNEEERAMALEELKDAYDIIQDPDARKYYLLYGAKPPEFMRHVSARHGGWGQEMSLGTHKYRVIIMWLDFLHRSIGVWGETAVLLGVLVFILARLPMAMKQSQTLLDDFEWQEQQSPTTSRGAGSGSGEEGSAE